MRFVSRGGKAAPSALLRRTSGKTELERARAYMSAPILAGERHNAFKFKAYKDSEVKSRLEEIFHGKCAYCESLYASHAPVDVEHYRPKGGVEEEPGHPGYWWLAGEWTNLLPSCVDCNRRREQRIAEATTELKALYTQKQAGKRASFPIVGVRALPEATELGGEGALLLDPTRDDPNLHLEFVVQGEAGLGLVLPKVQSDILGREENHAERRDFRRASSRGAVSIQVYGLNRLWLVQERARLVRHLQFMESLVVDIGGVIDRLETFNAGREHDELIEAVDRLRVLQTKIVDEMRGLAAPEAPFSATAGTYIQSFKRRLAGAAR